MDSENVVIPLKHETEIRVRYQETDAQGRVHHGTYATYFEIGRVEMLRAAGVSYRDLEASGIMLVVAQLECNFHLGAEYDDVLRLVTKVERARGVRVVHSYQLFRGDELVADGRTTVASINAETGEVVRLPRWLRLDR
ncbi:MAG: thioesterase family protein [Planctomycetota bacterium]